METLSSPPLVPTGQHAGASTLRPDAMSAPGSASSASGADDPGVTSQGYDGRHRERGEGS
jgi:hypothetical protein